jgi:hypothetical protein
LDYFQTLYFLPLKENNPQTFLGCLRSFGGT